MFTKALDYKNDTFRYDDNFTFNACVGKNGYNEMNDYEQGYDCAIKRLLRSATRDFDETLVYPIVFMARHRIELFLKNNIAIVSKCKFIKENLLKLQETETSHDLQKLWDKLEELCNTDKRLVKYLAPIKPFIANYFDIDPTGQTFRYPYDTENTHHLDDLLFHINLKVFKKKYLQMTKKMEPMNFMSLFILSEYEQGTFTSFCSRSEIEAISKELPPYSEWSNMSFKKLKTKLEKKHGLSSNQLSKILNIIKKHKEFSIRIDQLNPVNEINTKDISFFLQCYKELNSISGDKNFNDLKSELVHKICKTLKKDTICAWIAFEELGYFMHSYSEEYEKLISSYKSTDAFNDDFDFFVHCRIFKSGRELDNVKLGMKKCGQIHLLGVMP